jgi:hypothetical protein
VWRLQGDATQAGKPGCGPRSHFPSCVTQLRRVDGFGLCPSLNPQLLTLNPLRALIARRLSGVATRIPGGHHALLRRQNAECSSLQQKESNTVFGTKLISQVQQYQNVTRPTWERPQSSSRVVPGHRRSNTSSASSAASAGQAARSHFNAPSKPRQSVLIAKR